jgi:hypothetical protein
MHPKCRVRVGFKAKNIDADNLTAVVEAESGAPSVSEARQIAQIRQALNSEEDSAELPVTVTLSIGGVHSAACDLFAVINLNLKPLRFHREGDRNLNRLTFVIAVFDEKNNVVMVKQRHAAMDVPDDRLLKVLEGGLDVEMDFQLKPGNYRLRTVVADSEERRLTAVSNKIYVR